MRTDKLIFVAGLLALTGAAFAAEPDQTNATQPNAGRPNARGKDTIQAQLRQAVGKGVASLLPSGPVFAKRSGCVSCHNNTLPVMAASLARSRGIAVDAENERQQLKAIVGMATAFREQLLESSYAVPDTQVSIPYVLMSLAAEHVPADGLTSAAVHGIASRQLPDGSWPSYINRAPIENGDIQATALSVRAIGLYGMPGRSDEWKQRIASARAWLASAAAKTTEDKIMLVSGLAWAGAPPADVSRAAQSLLAEQRADGGWAQLPTLESDAYATGKVLASLHEAGVLQPNDPAYQKAVAYLLNTQQADGTWVVKSRAFPFQPLKESGFPHGRDQWISAAATSWASMALAYGVEPEPGSSEASAALLRVGDQNDVVGAKAAGVDQVAVR